jgi:hypothetical protein
MERTPDAVNLSFLHEMSAGAPVQVSISSRATSGDLAMRPRANFKLTRGSEMAMAVPRSSTTSRASRGVEASDLACDLCYVGCQFLSGPEQAACYLACDLLCGY